MKFINGIEFLGVPLSVWISSLVVFSIWLILLYSLKRFLFHKLKQWGPRLAPGWDRFLISSLHIPLNVVILSTGIGLLERLLPLAPQLDQPVALTVKVLTVIALFLFLDRLVMQTLQHFSNRMGSFDLSRGIVQVLIRFTVLSFGLLILLDALGISITPFIASLGMGSLAVALGLQETLANFFSGLYILADKPVRVGDFVRLESGEEGYVTEIGWRNTRIRMLPDIVVIVPNNKMISSTIRNYYLPQKELAVIVPVGVHYNSDLEKVERVTLEAAREIQKKVQGAVPNFEPLVRYHTFGESSIDFSVVLRAREFTDQFVLKHEFMKALHARYQKEGIVIPFPMRTVELAPQTLRALKGVPPVLDEKI